MVAFTALLLLLLLLLLLRAAACCSPQLLRMTCGAERAPKVDGARSH